MGETALLQAPRLSSDTCIHSIQQAGIYTHPEDDRIVSYLEFSFDPENGDRVVVQETGHCSLTM